MNMTLPDKSLVVSGLLTQVQSELDSMESLAQMARDEATSSETKSEGKYDTRATEASYLARGQAWRITELRQLVAWLSSDMANRVLPEAVVQVGALVRIEGTRNELVFVAPIGGAKTIVGDETIRVISPASPLGSAMAELEVGDGFEVESPRGVLDYEVVAVR
jgi:transcription elongation GreA/GreB family factor